MCWRFRTAAVGVSHPSRSHLLASRAPSTWLVRLIALGLAWPAHAQLSPDSWWPKFQRDAQNTGFVPVVGWVGDPHVVWAAPLGPTVEGECPATPVLSPGNDRLYVGLPGSTVIAVNAADGTPAWIFVLGDGTGSFCTTAAVSTDGAIYVGVWDNALPADGFCKLRDLGDSAELVWSFPIQRMLASPTITDSGLIILGGEHETDGWGYYALEDLGDTCSLAWAVPAEAHVGSSPAISPDGTRCYGAGFEGTLWEIDVATGAAAGVTLDCYAYASSPVVSEEGLVFLSEGMDFASPDEQTQGKMYAFSPQETTPPNVLDAEPLSAGHLNGGAGALLPATAGGPRLFVPANGYGADNAALLALTVTPDGATPLAVSWEVSLGPAALAYPQAVVTRDRLIYVIGPENHLLYAIRDADTQAQTTWTVDLSNITRVAGWTPDGARGPQGVTVGPDGTLYWNAPDGYLYALRGWPSGDLDGDGALTTADADWLLAVLVDPEGYALRFPEIDPELVGDLNGDGQLNFYDVDRLLALLGN